MMDWENKFSSIVRDTEASIAKVKVSLHILQIIEFLIFAQRQRQSLLSVSNTEPQALE